MSTASSLRSLSLVSLVLLTSAADASTWVGHPTVKAAEGDQILKAQITAEAIELEGCGGEVLTVRPAEPIELVAGAFVPAPEEAVCAVTLRVEAPITLRLAGPGGKVREVQLAPDTLRVEFPEGVEADAEGQLWIGLSELELDGDRALWAQLADAIVLG
jgi:hypothetical protein